MQWWKVWFEWGCLMGVMLALAVGALLLQHTHP